MTNIKLILACFLAVCLLTGCSSLSKPTQSDGDFSVSSAPETKEDYLNLLYGYHQDSTFYYSIAQDYFEQKSISDGTLAASDTLETIDLIMTDEGVQLNLIFYRNSRPPITLYCSRQGVLCNEDGTQFTRITQQEYESVPATSPHDVPTASATEDPYGSGYGEYESTDYEEPWYYQAFDMYELRMDLQSIDNLLAVGKEDQALGLIQEKIFKKLDQKVAGYIQSRDYWIAFNYVAMFNSHVSGNNTAECGSYPFVEQYFDEVYTSDDAIYGVHKAGFADHTQKYYVQIIQAEQKDSRSLTKQECLYMLNEYFLENGGGTRTSLWEGKFMYYTDNFDSTYTSTEYFIVSPYTGEMWYLPASFYFFDHQLYYEAAIQEYLKNQ